MSTSSPSALLSVDSHFQTDSISGYVNKLTVDCVPSISVVPTARRSRLGEKAVNFCKQQGDHVRWLDWIWGNSSNVPDTGNRRSRVP